MNCRVFTAICCLGILGASAGPVMAQGLADKCDAVLKGDLVNRVLTSNSANSDSRRAIRQTVLRGNVDEAYSLYNSEVDSAKAQGQAGSLGANYFGIGGDADFNIDYSNKISKEEFRKKFEKAQSYYKMQGEQTDASNTAVASTYASFIRDQKSIDAWKACITSDPQPNLYAYASRDDNGDAFLNVIWSPGDFAATFPSIKFDISLPNGASLTDQAREVAVGSGRNYRVMYPDQKKGFQITVNGELRKADGALVNNFTAIVRVPSDSDLVQASAPPAASPPPPVAAVRLDGVWMPESEPEFDVAKLEIVTTAAGQLSVIVTFKHGQNAPIVKTTTASLDGTGTYNTPTIVKQVFRGAGIGHRAIPDNHKISIGTPDGNRMRVIQTVLARSGKPNTDLPTMFKRI